MNDDLETLKCIRGLSEFQDLILRTQVWNREWSELYQDLKCIFGLDEAKKELFRILYIEYKNSTSEQFINSLFAYITKSKNYKANNQET